MDTGPVEPRQVGTKASRTLVLVGLFFIVGAVVVILSIIIGGVRKVSSEMGTDWKYLSSVRKADAATVDAQRKAGEAYKDKVKIEMKASAVELVGKGYKVTLAGKAINNGPEALLKMTAQVVFRAANGSQAESREVTLFDSTALSGTPTEPLGPINTEDFTITASGVSTDWDRKSLEWSAGEILVDVEAPTVETTAAK